MSLECLILFVYVRNMWRYSSKKREKNKKKRKKKYQEYPWNVWFFFHFLKRKVEVPKYLRSFFFAFLNHLYFNGGNFRSLTWVENNLNIDSSSIRLLQISFCVFLRLEICVDVCVSIMLVIKHAWTTTA